MDLETLLWCPACEGGYALDRVVAYAKNLPGDRLCACCMTVWHKGSVPIEFFEFEIAAPSLPNERNEICETCGNTHGHIDHDSGPRTLTNPHPFKPKIPPEFYLPADGNAR